MLVRAALARVVARFCTGSTMSSSSSTRRVDFRAQGGKDNVSFVTQSRKRRRAGAANAGTGGAAGSPQQVRGAAAAVAPWKHANDLRAMRKKVSV